MFKKNEKILVIWEIKTFALKDEITLTHLKVSNIESVIGDKNVLGNQEEHICGQVQMQPRRLPLVYSKGHSKKHSEVDYEKTHEEIQ